MSLASRVAASAFHRILTSSVSRSRQFRRPQQSATVSSYVRHVMLCAVCLCQWHSSLFAAHSQLIVASFTGMAACSIQQAFCGLSVHACDVLCVVRPDPGGGIQISPNIPTHRKSGPRRGYINLIENPTPGLSGRRHTEYRPSWPTILPNQGLYGRRHTEYRPSWPTIPPN